MPAKVHQPVANRAEAMSALLAQNWGAVALRGAVAIAFGLLTFILPGVTIATLVLLFAAYMLVDGVAGIVAAVRAAQRHERWGLLIAEGLADLATGIIAFMWPAMTVVVFIYLIAAWAVISGGLMLAAAFRLDLSHGRWMLALAGLISVIWGVLLIIAPIAGAVVLALWMGAYAIMFGAMLLALAFKLRQRRSERGGVTTTPELTSRPSP
jgi:uncharacterized membrane protein HdeD (DUF308 family)